MLSELRLYHKMKQSPLELTKDIQVTVPKGAVSGTSIIFSKKSPLAPIFKHNLLKLQEQGIIDKVYQNYKDSVLELWRTQDEVQILSAGQCMMAFVILALGMVAVLGVMLLECLIQRLE